VHNFVNLGKKILEWKNKVGGAPYIGVSRRSNLVREELPPQSIGRRKHSSLHGEKGGD